MKRLLRVTPCVVLSIVVGCQIVLMIMFMASPPCDNGNNNKGGVGGGMVAPPALLQQQHRRIVAHDDEKEEGTLTSTNNIPASTTSITEEEAASANAQDPVLADLSKFGRWKRLKRIVQTERTSYLEADPFPHIVLDGLFPSSIISKLEQELPELVDPKTGCALGSSKCFGRNRTDYKKSHIDKEERMGLYTKLLIGYLKSSTFVSFLEGLSNITGLIPDPHYTGSGLHVTAPGGYLNIHADFNYNDHLQLHRRVNLFVFLNPDWKEDFGGHLELWNRNMTSCRQRILPTLGRFVMFSSTDFSYHGHPHPLQLPEGRARRSLAMYYYTNGRPQEECLGGVCNDDSHGTLFRRPQGCKACMEGMCKAFSDTPTVKRRHGYNVLK